MLILASKILLCAMGTFPNIYIYIYIYKGFERKYFGLCGMVSIYWAKFPNKTVIPI